MIISFSLVNELFRAFHIQRWNDRIRPMELIEMDKHAHKMVIAYCLGRYEEQKGNFVDWSKLIKFGIFELLRRIVISDIKSPIYREIKKNKEVFAKLNKYVFNELKSKIHNETIINEIQEYLLAEEEDSLAVQILNAAHIYASYWEFQIIKLSNPRSYQNKIIEQKLLEDISTFEGLDGINRLLSNHNIINFIDLCSQLRFQIRWAQTPRVPKTSVLGHEMMVAVCSYFFTRDIPHCDKRIYNNFFGGLFHDLPEAVTRDIISPVKKSSEDLDLLIKNLERSLAEQEIFPLLDDFMIDEIKYFTQEEFSNKICLHGTNKSGLSFEEINSNYNSDEFLPFDGKIIRAADHLSAFLEAWNSCNYGICSVELIEAAEKIRENYRIVEFGEIRFNELYDQFTRILNKY
jgi:putative hydrolases of HD superfamily